MPKDNLGDLFTPAPLPVAPLDDSQRLACLRLIRSENVGPVTFRELINHFGGATAALEALPELSRRSGRGRPIVVCPRDRAESELSAAAKLGITPLFTIEPGYPAALAQLPVPPPLLYVKGRVDLLRQPTVAIVGARNGSAAGVSLTRLFATRLGEGGYVVASGLARGIDSAAHDAALATGTVAVLAGGLDIVYPPENAELQARIGRDGCLVTENPPGFNPRAQDFPRRNRIISGLSLAVIVVEAARRSGSLITARIANEQGRVVMAVPGHPLDPRAEGPLGLIKQGATMVTTADEVLQLLAPMRAPSAVAIRDRERFDEAPTIAPVNAKTAHVRGTTGNDAGITKAVLDALGPAPATIDDVARAAGIPVHLAKIALLELTLAGLVERHGSQLVSLRSSSIDTA